MNKNRFDGLQFRIMETLEQTKNVPLTAREVAERLHEKEYSDQLFDHVHSRVTMAVHAMKDKGKIVQHEARGVGGQLTYVLPKRMVFSQKPGDAPPANPVLKPDIAEKIVIKAPEPQKEPKRLIYAEGILDKIVEFVDNAPHPVALPEIVDALGHLYGNHFKTRGDMVTSFAANIYGLWKQRRLRRVNSSGRVKKVQYEYLTSKTGKTVPKPAEPVKAVEPVAKAVTSSRPVLFRPTLDDEMTYKEVRLKLRPSKYDEVAVAAKQFEIPIEDFCRQAIDFALSYAGDE